MRKYELEKDSSRRRTIFLAHNEGEKGGQNNFLEASKCEGKFMKMSHRIICKMEKHMCKNNI